jgi:two-component system LytT family response regulator
MINCIIVEDDKVHSDKLKQLLKKSEILVNLLAVADDIESAISAIDKFTPQLVFLDIELGTESGFDLLKRVKDISFDIIFTTSHIDANIQAIRACAISYLPKPIILNELTEALKKFQEKNNSGAGISQINTLRKNLSSNEIEEQVIWLNDKSDYFPIKVKDIIYCQSENQYTKFFVKNDKEFQYTSSKGIGQWESYLAQFGFCRIHNRSLVNIRHVIKYTRGDGGTVLMSNKTNLDVSKEGKQRFLAVSGLK